MSTAASATAEIPSGRQPLGLLGAPPARYARAFERVKAHGSSDALLPEGLFDELDQASDDFLAARSFLAHRLAAIADQDRAWRDEDRARQAEIERAARERTDPPPDRRTPSAWAGFTAGLPVEPPAEPPAAPAPEPRSMPNVHQGARAPMQPDEEAQLAAVMRQSFPGFR
jgi:hypothetical protein